ncbi:MAG: M15 family metallopeptidase [Bacillota bacterium]
MKRFTAAIILIICLLFISAIIVEAPDLSGAFAGKTSDIYDVTMKQDLLCIMLAYPEYVSGIEREGEKVYIVMKSGRKILYDDKKNKSTEGKISYPDLQDMLELIYPLHTDRKLMDKSFDPGRGRVYGLLKEVYGESKQQVEANLTNAKAHGTSYQFNRGNGAAKALAGAMNELIPMSEKRKDIRACIFPCSGTYNYRVIAGTDRLSPHAFGIAIDLARDSRDYWKWATAEQGQKRLSAYPVEIVEVFEKHNFIWGGKWGHFDILHFEYRPEIILKSRYFGNYKDYCRNWHEGAPKEDENVQKYIDIIEKALN